MNEVALQTSRGQHTARPFGCFNTRKYKFADHQLQDDVVHHPGDDPRSGAAADPPCYNDSLSTVEAVSGITRRGAAGLAGWLPYK